MSKCDRATGLLKKIARKSGKAPEEVLYEVLTGAGANLAEIEQAITQWEIYEEVSRCYQSVLDEAHRMLKNRIHEEPPNND